MTRPANPTTERIALAERVAEMRASGMLLREIADDIGKSMSYVSSLLSDPTGDAARARKDRLAKFCVGCGARVSYEGTRCRTCASVTYWTRGRILNAIREWATLTGTPPTATDWNPSHARAIRDVGEPHLWSDNPDRWPYSSIVQRTFGSWNAAVAAAGFIPRRPGERGPERFTSGEKRHRRLTQCKRGHDLTDPKNVYVYGDRRFCAECHRAANRRWKAKRRAIEVAQ